VQQLCDVTVFKTALWNLMTTAILFKIKGLPKITSLINSVILVGNLFQLYQRSATRIGRDVGDRLTGEFALMFLSDFQNFFYLFHNPGTFYTPSHIVSIFV
jgi:hypothetical protein